MGNAKNSPKDKPETEKESMAAKERRLKSYIWRETIKGVEKTFVERPLIEYDEESLQRFYNLCKEMLYNKSFENPGRTKVLSDINLQKRNCNIMLFLRYIRKRYGETEFTLHETLRKFIVNNRDSYPDIAKKPVGRYIMGNCPVDFKDVTIQELMSACMDSLGAFSSRHITKRLIFSQGIYLSIQDKKALTPSQDEIDSIMSKIGKENVDVFYDKLGKPHIRKLEVIRLRLGIKPEYRDKKEYRMFISKTGLTYNQFRAMIQLPSKAKYSELTVDQLQTLRDRILPTLELEVDKHISQWKRRMQEIKDVAEYRGFRITTSIGNQAEQ